MLENIKSPSDIKKLSNREVPELCSEIRNAIISHCAEHGGHLASNLGMVEPTVALHRVFDSPKDSIIFDVGHQCYAHKLICGRYENFSTLRCCGGISGFTNRSESEHDKLTAGHSGSALPTALGIAKAEKGNANGGWVVAVIGDGSFSNGMVYEALNECHDKDMRLIILLNDNEMSISKNVGAMSGYFSRLRNSRKYFAFKKKFTGAVGKLPFGESLIYFFYKVKEFFKRLVMRANLFENLGLYYMGPVNGNDEEKLEAVLREAKTKDECTIIHMMTLKGSGFEPAEKHPENFHFTGGFDLPYEEKPVSAAKSFSSVFGEHLCTMRERNDNICAITAAMEHGTGLSVFGERYPDSFYDVGIAEECAVTFAGGLAIGGKLPVCALYSTFMQRTYDQLMEDIALQDTHVIMGVDRAGLVPGDGVTHQGLYDVSMLASIPNITIYSPDSYRELEVVMDRAENDKGLVFVRYPKGSEPEYDRSGYTEVGRGIFARGCEGADAVIVTYGRISAVAHKAAELAKAKVGIMRAAKIRPLDIEAIAKQAEGAKLIYVLEEGAKRGGIGEEIAAYFGERGGARVCIHAAPAEFIPHGEIDELFEMCGFTAENVAANIDKMI